LLLLLLLLLLSLDAFSCSFCCTRSWKAIQQLAVLVVAAAHRVQVFFVVPDRPRSSVARPLRSRRHSASAPRWPNIDNPHLWRLINSMTDRAGSQTQGIGQAGPVHANQDRALVVHELHLFRHQSRFHLDES
jgi:hypothetical protein